MLSLWWIRFLYCVKFNAHASKCTRARPFRRTTKIMSVWRYPLDHLLGSRAKISILRSFMTLGRAVSGRHAARLAQVAEKTARNALEDLVALGIITRGEATGQYLYSPNRENVLWDHLRQLFDAERERLQTARRALLEAVDVQDSAVSSLLLFGSAARTEDAPGSDLDLLVLVENETGVWSIRNRLADALPSLERQFGMHLSPLILTSDEFQTRRKEGDPLIEAIVRDAEIIYGPDLIEADRG